MLAFQSQPRTRLKGHNKYFGRNKMKQNPLTKFQSTAQNVCVPRRTLTMDRFNDERTFFNFLLPTSFMQMTYFCTGFPPSAAGAAQCSEMEESLRLVTLRSRGAPGSETRSSFSPDKTRRQDVNTESCEPPVDHCKISWSFQEKVSGCLVVRG